MAVIQCLFRQSIYVSLGRTRCPNLCKIKVCCVPSTVGRELPIWPRSDLRIPPGLCRELCTGTPYATGSLRENKSAMQDCIECRCQGDVSGGVCREKSPEDALYWTQLVPASSSRPTVGHH